MPYGMQFAREVEHMEAAGGCDRDPERGRCRARPAHDADPRPALLATASMVLSRSP